MAFSAPEPGDERSGTEPSASADQPRSPLLAFLGAGDAAVAAVARAFSDAFSAASGTQKTVQQRVADLPNELEALRGRFSGDELRRALDAYRVQVERAYTDFAGRGGETWERLRETPQVRQAMTALESFSGRAADAVVDASAATANVVEGAGAATAGAGADTSIRQVRES